MSKRNELEIIEQQHLPYPAITLKYASSASVNTTKWKIPGLGQQTKAKCGTVIGAHVCPTGLGGHPSQLLGYHCKNFNCPVCYPWAAMQGAHRAADRIFGGLKAYGKIGRRLGYRNHIEISVPPSEYDLFDWKSYKDKAIAFAQKIGFSGGVIVAHPARVNKDLKVLIIEAMKANGIERLRYWDGVRKDILGLGSFEAYLDWGPHFHIIGYFKVPKYRDKNGHIKCYTSEQFFEDTDGWTYKNITVERAKRDGYPVKQETFKSVYGILNYLLTHHLVEPNKSGVTYFGDIAYNKVGFTEEESYSYIKCPVCQEQMFKVYAQDIDGVLGGEIKIERGVNAVTSKYKVKRKTYYVILQQTAITDKKFDKSGLIEPKINVLSTEHSIMDKPLVKSDITIDDAFIALMERKFKTLSSESNHHAIT